MVRNVERPLALVGLMGAGKSAVARELGERWGALVADLDAMLEASEGRSVAEVFARDGEAYFRRREGELLDQALAAGAQVVACGGGLVLDPRRRQALRERCTVVWLEVSPEEAARRVTRDGGTRPLLAGAPAAARLAEILAERAPLYAEVAAIRLVTDGRTPAQVVDQLEQTLAATGS